MTEQPYPTAPPPPQGSNGLAIAALICGILSLLLSWIPLINVLAAVLALVAIILGALGIRRANEPYVGGKGMAIAGIICGAIGCFLAIAFIANM